MIDIEPSWTPPPDREPQQAMLALPDGYQTPVTVHEPPAAVPRRAPVVYLHGIQSHPGWFYRSAVALADAGHAVYQPARRGSGTNQVDRGHAESPEQLLDDLARAIDLAQAATGCDTCHLLGVSWGGKLAAAFAAMRPGEQQRLASLTLVAPGICPQVDVAGRTKLAIAMSLLCCSRRRFEIPLSDPERFTDNEAMRDYLRDDPARLHRATARFLYVSRCLDRSLRRAQPGAISTPTSLLLAGRDRIIDNAATRSLCHRVCGKAWAVHEFDAAHTIEFEADLAGFLEVLRDATDSA
ncbi:MAG: alpha/beta fold hydrolase [Planctomycetes bacterium]|jgi:alpha-beta hydrolase superfamily lysophospholipase|nr:alpha/beta fold hydrolase [Planctomycetota bacterium]